MAARASGQKELHQESIKNLVDRFRQNLVNAFLTTEQKEVQVTSENNSRDYHTCSEISKSNEKSKKRHVSVDDNEAAKRKCHKAKGESNEKTISADTSINNSQKNIDDGKASTDFSKHVKLKFRCSFCAERFASLVTVRDHVRNNHKEENRQRKQGKCNNEVQLSKKEREILWSIREKILTRNSEAEPIVLYFSNACKFIRFEYDSMIRHCQDHIIQEEDPEYCLNTSERIRYLNVLGQKYNVDLFTYNFGSAIRRSHLYKKIDCDYKLMKTDKWPGNFDTFTKPEIHRINGASIYNFTRIIRLSSDDKSTSAPFMLYQCMRCKTHVNPHAIVSHVQQNSCHENHNSFPCYDCERAFSNESAMYLHYKTHKVANADEKYKTILFNGDEDFYVNTLLLKAAGMQVNYAPAGKYAMPQKHATIVSHDEHTNETCSQKANDARTMIIRGRQSEYRNKTTESRGNVKAATVKERASNIYKCQCKLCFHSLESLFKHLENCPCESTFQRCTCGLNFDEAQYSAHHNMHSEGFTSFNVKRVTVSDEQTIDLQKTPQQIVENEPKQNVINEKNKERDHGDEVRANQLEYTKGDQETILCKDMQLNVLQREAVSEFAMSLLKLISCRTVDSKTLGRKQKLGDTRANCFKQDNLSNTATLKSARMCPTVMQTTQVSSEVAKQVETGDKTGICYDDKVVLGSKSHNRNENLAREENTEENRSTVYTTMDVELEDRRIVLDTNPDNEQQKKVPNDNQATVETPSQNNNLKKKIIEKSTNEGTQTNIDDEIRNLKSKNIENKIYTEDELLDDTDASVYFDVDESLLDDDEDN